MREMKIEYKRRVKKARKVKCGEKRLHRMFMRDVSEVADERSWQWLLAGYLGKEFFFRAMIEKECRSEECVARRWSWLGMWRVAVLVWHRWSIRGSIIGWVEGVLGALPDVGCEM